MHKEDIFSHSLHQENLLFCLCSNDNQRHDKMRFNVFYLMCVPGMRVTPYKDRDKSKE